MYAGRPVRTAALPIIRPIYVLQSVLHRILGSILLAIFIALSTVLQTNTCGSTEPKECAYPPVPQANTETT